MDEELKEVNPYQSPEPTESTFACNPFWLAAACITAFPMGHSFYRAFIKPTYDWTAPYDAGWFFLFGVFTAGLLYAFATDKGD